MKSYYSQDDSKRREWWRDKKISNTD